MIVNKNINNTDFKFYIILHRYLITEGEKDGFDYYFYDKECTKPIPGLIKSNKMKIVAIGTITTRLQSITSLYTGICISGYSSLKYPDA